MKQDKAWIYKVFLFTFILSCLFSVIASSLGSTNGWVELILLIITIVIGILFDMIGISILTSKPATFNSMASQGIKGGKETLNLIKNSSKFSSICNDVVGDICGIVSGSLGALLAIELTNLGMNALLSSVLVTALISSLTVGGKAICKQIAISNSDSISFMVGKLVSLFHKSK